MDFKVQKYILDKVIYDTQPCALIAFVFSNLWVWLRKIIKIMLFLSDFQYSFYVITQSHWADGW